MSRYDLGTRSVAAKSAVLALVVAAAAIGLCADSAFAAEGTRVRPGARVFAELRAGDELPLNVEAVGGSLLTVKCKAWKQVTLLPVLRVTGPDGVDLDLADYLKTNRKGNVVAIKKLPLPASGTYVVRISGDLATAGGFDLTTAAKAPKRVKGESDLIAGAPGESALGAILFGALDGDLVSCVVKPAARSSARPLLTELQSADGAVVAFDATKKVKRLPLTGSGEHAFVVADETGSDGTFRYTLSFKQKKANKAWRDVRDLMATGSISGRILVAPNTRESRVVGKVRTKSKRPRGKLQLRAGELVVSVPTARNEDDVLAALAVAVPNVRFEVAASMTESGPYLVRVARLVGRRGLAARRESTRSRGARRRNEARTGALAKAASSSSALAWAEPNQITRVTKEPNDALFTSQSDFRDMWLPEAWNFTTGGNVVVAVVDTGIWPTHPDLAGRLLSGYDFVTSASSAMDGTGRDADPTDSHRSFHGTHVAGTIGAATNNRDGVAGVLWNARMVPVRVLGQDGGTSWDVAAGIRWAAGLPVSGAPTNANPADVINLSLGSIFQSQVERLAVADSLSAGCVIVAAAGNDDSDLQFYPAAYPGVIAVAAVAPDFYPASYSNYGNWVSVSAPGGDLSFGLPGILSTYVDSTTLAPTYLELEGTSMASPHVAGVVALMLSIDPTLTPPEVKDILELSAFDLGNPGFDVFFGWGMVDAEFALRGAGAVTPLEPVLQHAPSSLEFGSASASLDIYIRNSGGGAIAIQNVSVTTDFGGPWLTAVLSSSTVPTTINVTVDHASLGATFYRGTVDVETSEGSFSVPVVVDRLPPPDPGFVRVQVIDDAGQIVAQANTSQSKNWEYAFDDLPAGSYRINAWSDRNSNLRIDRVDEWSGAWPLTAAPERVRLVSGALDREGIDFAMDRYDARFTFEGSGGGRIDGALAVRVIDNDAREPIPGAKVFLGNASRSETTDSDGRAVFSGTFSGAQTITVTADGFGPRTQIASDAQYQSFTLTREEPETFDVTVTVRGLGIADEDVLVQVGDDWEWVTYDGVTDPIVALAPSQTRREVPVWVMTRNAAGDPSSLGFETLAPVTSYQDLSVSVTTARSGAGSRIWSDKTTVALPTWNFDPETADLFASVQVFWTVDQFLILGTDTLIPDVLESVRWMSIDELDVDLPAAAFILAEDEFGALSAHVTAGAVNTLNLPLETVLLDPSYPESPGLGETIGVQGPTFTFEGMLGANLHVVEIWDTITERTWTIRVPGNVTTLTLPVVPTYALQPGREYLWRVTSYVSPGLNPNGYLDEALVLDITDYTVSWWNFFETE